MVQVIFRFALALEMIPLTGTTSAQHMREDLTAYEVALSDEEVEATAAAGGCT